MAFYVMFTINVLKGEWRYEAGTPLPYVSSTSVVSPLVRYALGAPFIYKTYDGGLHWQRDSIDVQLTKFTWTSYQYITFLDANTGYVQCTVGDSNFIFTTTDAGYSWNRKFPEALLPAERIKFISENEWIALSNFSVRSSSDAGSHWNVVTLPGKDSSLFDMEVMKDGKWLMVLANTVYISGDKGSSWQKTGDLDLFTGIDSFNFAHFDYVGMGETSDGIKLLFNVYFVGCGSYYDHSLIYNLEKLVHGWQSKRTQFNFNSAPSGIIYRNDTGYITTTLGDIYKCTDRKEGWYRIFKLDCYKDGYLQGIVSKDGVLYAYTSMGKLFSNATPADDKNLTIGAQELETQKVLVFPNPAKDQLTLRMPEADHSLCTLSIVDITGKVVLTIDFQNEGDLLVNTADMAGGQYFYNITTPKNNFNGTITILQ